MSKTKAGFLAAHWGALMVFFFVHLFDIPGLIARHHQGYISRAFGPWISYAIALLMIAIAARYTLIYARLWLQARPAANQVRVKNVT